MNEQTVSITTYSASDTTIAEPPIFNDIREAIAQRRVVALRYDKDTEPRRFAPYLFRLAKTGNYVVAGMQISNPNSPDADNQRRTFNLEKMNSFELTDELFVPIGTFKADDPSHSTGIIVCVLS